MSSAKYKQRLHQNRQYLRVHILYLTLIRVHRKTELMLLQRYEHPLVNESPRRQTHRHGLHVPATRDQRCVTHPSISRDATRRKEQ